jgi:hypothetical protein
MALEVEGVVDGGVHAEKPLGGASRLEALHFALASSHRLMRVFRSIIFPQPLLMRAGQSQTPERGGVGAQLVGDQQFGCEALLLEELAHQPQRRPSVASTLNQHVENLALMVHTLAMVQMAEAGGFGIVWITEHHAIEQNISPAPFQLMAFLAAHTSRIRLGSAVAVAPYWHPVKLAGEAALFDLLSKGRLEFGIGRGA